MAKKSNLSVSSPLLYIILGALLVIFGVKMLGLAMTIAGIIFVLLGIVDILRKNIVNGIVNAAVGIIILVLGGQIADIVLLVLGILIAVKGVIDLLAVLSFKSKKIIRFVSPVLTVVTGLALAFGNGLDIIITVVGVLLIVDGLLGLLGARK